LGLAPGVCLPPTPLPEALLPLLGQLLDDLHAAPLRLQSLVALNIQTKTGNIQTKTVNIQTKTGNIQTKTVNIQTKTGNVSSSMTCMPRRSASRASSR
jgi:hypothetical protein